IYSAETLAEDIGIITAETASSVLAAPRRGLYGQSRRIVPFPRYVCKCRTRCSPGYNCANHLLPLSANLTRLPDFSSRVVSSTRPDDALCAPGHFFMTPMTFYDTYDARPIAPSVHRRRGCHCRHWHRRAAARVACPLLATRLFGLEFLLNLHVVS